LERLLETCFVFQATLASLTRFLRYKICRPPFRYLNIVSLTADAAVVPKNAIKGSLFGIQNDKTGKPT
jgi:hypothetical protein